jgi:hypothetical protein
MSLKVVSTILLIEASSTPSNPPTGFIYLYVKSDKNLYTLTSTGVETRIN